jgi:protein ImuA
MRIGGHDLIPLSTLGSGTAEPVCRWQTGVAELDQAIGGGFAFGRVHEVFAASTADVGASAGFALAVAFGGAAQEKPIVWLRTERAARGAGAVQAAGFADFGGAPGACLFVLTDGTKALLRAAVDSLQCGGLGAVVVEGWGRMPELDLTASRRLLLAAKQSGVPLLLLRVDAVPVTSAAETRWEVSAAPSQALAANAPGYPCFDVKLLRCRSRPAGQSWRLEWDRDRNLFRDAAFPGAMVPVPVRKPIAETGSGLLRRVA